jgi:hypothetical protein
MKAIKAWSNGRLKLTPNGKEKLPINSILTFIFGEDASIQWCDKLGHHANIWVGLKNSDRLLTVSINLKELNCYIEDSCSLSGFLKEVG